MKLIKYILPVLFVAVLAIVSTPKLKAISTDDFFNGLESQVSSSKSKGKVVAFYKSGLHGIPGEFEDHEGKDIVIQLSKDCKNLFKQFFYGTSPSEGLHGVLSIWRIADKKGDCYKGEILIKDAFPEWGDYLEPGKDYCVTNKIFKDFKEMNGEMADID